ncbi:MAG TPA: AMP-binding protein [Desulfatirhabdiaceae bacterium]|nr:AMP-binding protein [Desulfatirhabdiaceae bacterium]
MRDVYSEKPWIQHYDSNVPPALAYEETTFAEMFRKTAEAWPDKSALIYMGKRLTFQDVDKISNRIARYLIQRGLKPNDVIGLHLPNIPAHYIAVIAAQKAGCISTGLSPLLMPAEMAHQITDSGLKMIFTVDVLFGKLAEIANKTHFTTVVVSEIADFLPGVKRMIGKLLKKIPTGVVSPLAGKTIERFTTILKETPDDPIMVSRNFDDPIFMMYTGGTTGPAKGAVLTQKSYMCNRLQVLTWLDMQPDDTVLSAFPMFHMAGLALGAGAITMGITQICVPKPRDTHFQIHAIKSYHPTMMINVPTVYYELMKKPAFRKLNFDNIKWLLSAAAPFPKENIQELESVIGKNKFIELYGMTETSPVTCCNPRYGPKKAGSIGLPMPDTEFKLIDPETGIPAEPGEPGEIVIRGPQVMREYHNNPNETAHALKDGWIFTGDVARMDADGYFHIVDRLKDMVIVSGFKVFTKELDDVLSKHPDISLAASVGIPDPDRPGSERVACAIVLKPGVNTSDIEKEKILGYLKQNVAPYSIPRLIRFMDQLPTSGVGKILKREIRKLLSEDTATP